MQSLDTFEISLDTLLAMPTASITAPLGAHVERMTTQQIFAHFSEVVLHATLLRMGATVLARTLSAESIPGEALPNARVQFRSMDEMLMRVDGSIEFVRSEIARVAPPGTPSRAFVDLPRVVWLLPANVPRGSTSAVIMTACGIDTTADNLAPPLPPLRATDVMDDALRDLAAMVVARCAPPRGPCSGDVQNGQNGDENAGTHW